MNNIDVIKYQVEDKKIKGVLAQSSDGETVYWSVREYQVYLTNTGKKISVRFPNEITYDEVNLDLEKFEISNEFDHEYFGWYNGTAIALKK